MLTLAQDSALPSLFGACHEEPYDATKRGFASWPKTKWPWGGKLAEREGVLDMKIHRGKTLFVTGEAARAVDPLCRDALEVADAAADDGARILRHLRAAGPSTVDDLKAELGLDATALRKAREKLERFGAVVSRGIAVDDAKGGHRHSSELSRWDQVWRKPWRVDADTALAELVVIGVRAAVLAHEDEVAREWFSWPVPRAMIAALLSTGRLQRPASGWLAPLV